MLALSDCKAVIYCVIVTWYFAPFRSSFVHIIRNTSLVFPPDPGFLPTDSWARLDLPFFFILNEGNNRLTMSTSQLIRIPPTQYWTTKFKVDKHYKRQKNNNRSSVQNIDRSTVQNNNIPSVQYNNRSSVQNIKRSSVQNINRSSVQNNNRSSVQNNNRSSVQNKSEERLSEIF